MSPWELGSLYPALPPYCTPTDNLLWRLSSTFHTCVPTPLAFLSTLLGCLSITSWLFAQLPQIFKNYKLQSTAGLSVFFLIEWLLGDTANLFGALLTKQATWQVVVAAYYVFVDCAMVSQYVWYTLYTPWREEKARKSMLNSIGPAGFHPGSTGRPNGSPDQAFESRTLEGKPPSKPREVPFNAFRFPNFSSSSTPYEKGTPSSSSSRVIIHRVHQSTLSPAPSPKTLLLIAMLCAVLTTGSPLRPPVPSATAAALSAEYDYEPLGRVLSWTSTILYLGSRLPQLLKNHSRRSTAGLSASLFLAAFFGNLFYAASLLTNPLAWHDYSPYGGHGWAGAGGSVRAEWLALAAPFWLGAAGVLALDAAIGVQFWMFGVPAALVLTRKASPRGRWQHVTGWMRGWVPSSSPERSGSRAEQDALLAAAAAAAARGTDGRDSQQYTYGAL